MATASRATSLRSRCASSDLLQLVAPDDRAQGAGALVDDALLRREVDADQTEPRAVAVGPLVVVEQRPVEVAEHRDVLADRARHLPQVHEDELPARGVAARGNAVLGDQDRELVAR